MTRNTFVMLQQGWMSFLDVKSAPPWNVRMFGANLNLCPLLVLRTCLVFSSKAIPASSFIY